MKQFSKLFSLLAGVVLLSNCSQPQEGFYQDDAINALDELTATIGEMAACSYMLNVHSNDDNGVVDKVSDVYMKVPGKLYIHTESTDNRKSFWLEDGQLYQLNLETNEYDVVSTPKGILAMIDSVHAKTGIDFPAADLFYPTFTDDMIAQFDSIMMNGEIELDGMVCKEVRAVNPQLEVFLALDPEGMPEQLALYGLGEKAGEEYVANFSNWRVDPELPDMLFQFEPPSNAVKAELFKSTTR